MNEHIDIIEKITARPFVLLSIEDALANIIAQMYAEPGSLELLKR